MKLLRFILLMFRKGSLSHTPHNFEQEREQVLKEIPHPRNYRAALSKNKIIYTLKANLGYLLHARHMSTQLYASKEKQLVYVRILKSASTSLLRELLPAINPQLRGRTMTDQQVDALAFYLVQKKLRPEEEGYQKIALVRNPFHRLVSVYLDLFDPDSTHFSYDVYWFGILKKDMGFQEFLETICQIPEFLRGPHFASQHFILSRAVGLSKIKVYRIDKDQQELEIVLKHYSLSMAHANRNSKYDYWTFYNRQTLEKVYQLYKQDVISFGYQQEYEELLSKLKA